MNRMDWVDLPDLKTPFVLIHKGRLLENLRRAAAIAEGAGIRLRPHVKTHKSVELARLQQAHGAAGLTASKPSEAEVFVRAGFKDILLAYPVVDPERVMSLLQAADRAGASVTFIADSMEGIAALARAGERFNRIIPVQFKIDVGLHRCGVAADSPALERLALSLREHAFLTFAGLLSHAGHAYAAKDREQLLEVSRSEQRQMAFAKDRLAKLGYPDATISVGSTPTVFTSESFVGIDEIRPGNYVFFDLTAVRLGVASVDDIALGVVTTIVSANDQFYIVDSGSKALTSDLGAHSSGGAGFGLALPLGDNGAKSETLPVVRLSEEHGFIERRESRLPIGTRMLVLPNHACPVVNLFDSVAIHDSDGGPDLWSVNARGKVV
ncbi:alanine racemase [Microvirga sp. 2TAF3]|uniref:alanine racemase n=1 Tax=Microvirga sp. 2TAF3 TaxID=3233014 RepID=UPI003F99C03D